MIGARRRLTTAAGAAALLVLTGPAAALAQDGASDTGHKDAGESASAWDAGGWAFWTVIVLALLCVLILALVYTARRGRDGEDEGEEPAAPPVPTTTGAPTRPVARTVEDETPAAGWELAVLAFEHPTGAEHAFAAVREHVEGDPAWLHDVAFAESRRHGRMLLRGTFAGRYVDARDLSAVPAESPVLQALRDGVPEGGSGLVSFAPAAQVATLVEAFSARAADVHRHPASAQEAATLAAAVAGAPKATAPRPAP